MAFAVTAVIEQNNKGKKSKLTESDIFCEKKGNGSGFEGNNVEIWRAVWVHIALPFVKLMKLIRLVSLLKSELWDWMDPLI